MSLKFLLASGNAHKAQEFGELFNKEILSINPAPEKVEVVEDGVSYRENALKKAAAYFNKFSRPVMADDSGLDVMALPDELGIHTARFGGENLSASQRNQLLLERLKEVQDDGRAAQFVCILCFYLSEKEIFFFEGRLKGSIALAQAGDQGFGYDPVFLPEKAQEGKTLAELPEWKALHSHRALACQSAENFFKERV